MHQTARGNGTDRVGCGREGDSQARTGARTHGEVWIGQGFIWQNTESDGLGGFGDGECCRAGRHDQGVIRTSTQRS